MPEVRSDGWGYCVVGSKTKGEEADVEAVAVDEREDGSAMASTSSGRTARRGAERRRICFMVVHDAHEEYSLVRSKMGGEFFLEKLSTSRHYLHH